MLIKLSTWSSQDQNALRSHRIKVGSSLFESAKVFKYLATTLKYQNSIQKEIKNKFKSRNSCCLSVQNLLTSSLLSKNIKVEIYGKIVLPIVLYGCEILSLKLRGEIMMRVFKNRVLRRIFGPKRDEVTGEWRKLHNESLIICIPHPIFFG